MARHNLNAYGLRADAVVEDVQLRIRTVDPDVQLHIDPARRNSTLQNRNQRASQWEFYSPGPDTLSSAIEMDCCIKLAPACRLPDEIVSRCELEWVEELGECKQQLLWSRGLARGAGCRTATVSGIQLGDGCQWHSLHAMGLSQSQRPEFQWEPPEEGDVLFRPRPAVLAAELVDHLAVELGVARLDCQPRYLVANRDIPTPFATRFRVLRRTSARIKQLKADLQAEDCGHLEAKCGGEFNQLALAASKLRLSGQRRLTLIATMLGGSAAVWICERLTD